MIFNGNTAYEALVYDFNLSGLLLSERRQVNVAYYIAFFFLLPVIFIGSGIKSITTNLIFL